MGSPQQGTLTALPWPGRVLAGIADLKTGSALLRRLNGNLGTLLPVECCSFYCQPDLMVMPPCGPGCRSAPATACRCGRTTSS